MKKYGMLIILLALSLMDATPAMTADYDLVISSGRVMDPETKYDKIANVGIKNGTIAIITNK